MQNRERERINSQTRFQIKRNCCRSLKEAYIETRRGRLRKKTQTTKLRYPQDS